MRGRRKKNAKMRKTTIRTISIAGTKRFFITSLLSFERVESVPATFLKEVARFPDSSAADRIGRKSRGNPARPRQEMNLAPERLAIRINSDKVRKTGS